MTTVAVLNQKGGSGKTTLAVNLAHALSLNGDSVLLVDSDSQGSARDWNSAAERKLIPVVGLDRETLSTDIKAVSGKHDWLVVDGAPRIEKMAGSAIKCADVILIPVQPSPLDIWAVSDLVEIIQARQAITDGTPKAAFVISRAVKNTKLSGEVEEALASFDLPVFTSCTTQRVIYPQSMSTGETVMCSQSPAYNEIMEIAQELRGFIYESERSSQKETEAV